METGGGGVSGGSYKWDRKGIISADGGFARQTRRPTTVWSSCP
ncbi:hypothetical protein NXX66_05220 [Parabacteroides distasonis]|nr:hypothetical protein NXX66_05220 [Parabacteroides distasonis]